MKDTKYLLDNNVDLEKSLELFGDIETYNESIKDFIVDATDKIEKLKLYKENADMAKFAIEVHALKSDAKYFGFTNLAELALDQELKSKENNMFYISEHFDELEKEALHALNIAKVYIGEENEESLQKNNKEPISSPKNETILIVDDSEVIKRFIEKIFYDKYKILVASDGMEALNIINENIDNNIVGVFLDLNMPNVNGFQVLDYFKQNNLFEKIPVSIITGVGSDELIANAYNYPIIDVLRKPFNEKDIKLVVEKTVNKNS